MNGFFFGFGGISNNKEVSVLQNQLFVYFSKHDSLYLVYIAIFPNLILSGF